MTDTITLPCGTNSTMTVTAHPTATPGLIVHDLGLFGDQWRIAHQPSSCVLGEFDNFQHAQTAAAAMQDLADWTGAPTALQDEDLIWKAIDAIEDAGGRFLPRPGGIGERVAAKRAQHLATKTGKESA